jgi:hypothetical protein
VDARRPDGLFTGLHGTSVWRVPIAAGPTCTAGAPVHVTDLPGALTDVTPDGQRFLVLRPDRGGTESLTVVRNWRAGLPR